jgi:Cu/Ag efflux protein CusF
MKLLGIAVAILLVGVSAGALGQAPMTGGTMTATAPGKAAAVNTIEVTAAVKAIDQATRTVTLKAADGHEQTITLGPEVKNLKQIKVGDQVVARYVEALSLELKKGGKALVARTDSEAAGRAMPGEKPAGGVGRQVHVTADVIALDSATQTVTLRGPKQTVDLKIHDPEQFKLVKVGDQVEATYTEALAIAVEPAPAKK